MELEVLNRLQTIAFTHRIFDVANIGKLHIAPEEIESRFQSVKSQFNLDEVMMLSTCNRVEFNLVTEQDVSHEFLQNLLLHLYPNMAEDDVQNWVEKAELYNGLNALDHALSVASSIDSMVIGEREIITQVRQAYENCAALGLTGDLLRILNRHAVETAKKVYTQTSISAKPVSVVSLAYHQLKRLQIPLDARFLIVGAGVTNTTMGRFLKKHGYKHFSVFNRTYEKAVQLAAELGGQAYELRALAQFTQGFDVIITCTGADRHLITTALYEKLVQGETQTKTVIDLAIPQDLDPEIINRFPVRHISVSLLQQISNENIQLRAKELVHVEEILQSAREEFLQICQERQIELAMKEVPEQIKRIKEVAVQEVFKTEINGLDAHSREVLEKVLGYVEKKYIAGPMKLAKEIMVKHG